MIAQLMIARRSILLLSLAAFLPRTGRAQPASLKAGEILRGRFTQERHLKGFAAPIQSAGSFLLSPGRGLIWRVSRPFATTTVVTPDGLVQTADGRELTRLPSSRVPFLARLFELLTAVLEGDWTALDGQFAVTRTPKAAGEELVLVPRRPEDVTITRIQSISVVVGRFAEAVRIQRVGDDFDLLSFLDQSVTSDPLTADEVALFDSARS